MVEGTLLTVLSNEGVFLRGMPFTRRRDLLRECCADASPPALSERAIKVFHRWRDRAADTGDRRHERNGNLGTYYPPVRRFAIR